jgi:hypothetical protein
MNDYIRFPKAICHSILCYWKNYRPQVFKPINDTAELFAAYSGRAYATDSPTRSSDPKWARYVVNFQNYQAILVD